MAEITAQEARAYCHWLGGELPTDPQWEYAARSGGQNQIFSLEQ